jgi:hypothetical protein
MEINRNNYEAYLLDLLEGRLTASEEQEVREFLSHHPDLPAGLEELDPWVLENKEISYPHREQLKKEIPDESSELKESNFDLFSIARLEGDLTPEQEQEHSVWVEADETKKKQWEMWQQTRLHVPSISYKNKARLRHKDRRNTRVIWLSVISSAAAIALLFTLLKMDTGILEPSLTEEQNITSQESPLTSEVSNASKESPAGRNEITLPDRPTTSEQATEKPASKPVVRARSNNTDPEEGTSKEVDRAPEADTTKQPNRILLERIEIGPIRMASLSMNRPVPLKGGTYDQIKPLEIPESRIHFSSLSLAQLTELDLQEMFDAYTEENDISLWTLADLGIRGINRITGSDISLMAARDEQGDVSGFSLKGRRFSIQRPLDRSE